MLSASCDTRTFRVQGGRRGPDHGEVDMGTALATLWISEAANVYRFARRRSASHEQAEDLVADVFVAACAAIDRDPDVELTGAWLMTVARRRIVDHWRRLAVVERRRPTLKDAAMPEVGVEEEVIERHRVHDLLSALPRRQSVVVVERCLRGRSASEVGDLLGLSSTAVDSLLARARRSLAQVATSTAA